MHIAAYFVIGALLLLAGLLYMLKRRHRAAIAEVDSVYPAHARILTSNMANFFGLESAGMKQIRGNGILLLTARQIYFRMLLPSREVVIPVEAISAIETPSSFLGKTRGMKLLKVEFESCESADSAAWLVRNLDEWVSAVSKAAGLQED